ADRLVRLLRVLRLRRIAARRLGKVLLAVALRDHAAQLVERLVRERDRVGAHVRDQTDRALADVDALIEALRDRHRLLRAEAELARRFLLQRRRRERRGRIPAALLLLDRGDREDADRIRGHVAARRARLDAALRVARRGLVRERELLDLRAFEYREPRLERLVGVPHRGFDRPVLLRLERRDLVLALDDQPERRALHAARGQPPPHLLPQQRRQIEADEIVERAARLLRVDQLRRELARALDRLADRSLRDLVEDDPVNGLRVEDLTVLEHLVDMPRDRLALTVRVRREVDPFGLRDRLRDPIDVLLVLVDQLILHREPVFRVHGAFLRHEVAHVTVRREHLEILAE